MKGVLNMKKIIIPCIFTIVAVLGGLMLYSYSNKTIIDASKVTEINVPAPSIKDPQLKYKSFTDTQSIAEFIKILNSSKPLVNVKKQPISGEGKAYPIVIHNKDSRITYYKKRIFYERDFMKIPYYQNELYGFFTSQFKYS